MAKSDDWSTPPALVKALYEEFNFNVEICASLDNRALNPLPYMGLDNDCDALTHDWTVGDRGFCNPPYSQLPAFIQQAGDQHELYKYTTFVLLVPAYTDTKIWQEDIQVRASEVRLLKGRLAFLMGGKKQTTARFPSAVVIYRPTQGRIGNCTVRFWDYRADWKDT